MREKKYKYKQTFYKIIGYVKIVANDRSKLN